MATTLTNEEMQRRKGTNKKILKYFVLPVIGLILVIVIAGSLSDDKPDGRSVANRSDNESTNRTSNVIPGLAPVDVYLNMEKQGFTTEKQFSSEYGNSWICKNSVDGIDYEVSAFSMSPDGVENVKATAIIDPSENKIIATQQFLLFVSSLPFENSKPEETAQWIRKNFNNDKATKIVGDVKFTIYAPTKMLRMLAIERV